MPLVGGMFVKTADPLLIEELKRRGVLWKRVSHGTDVTVSCARSQT